MAKLKDGFYKLTASSIGSDLLVLLAGGGAKPISDFAPAFNVKLWGNTFNGSSDVNGAIQFATAGNTGLIKFLNGEFIDGYGNFHLGSNSASWNVFDNNQNYLFTILKSGNVGIGTTTPEYKLDVSGKIKADALYLTRSNGDVAFTIAEESGTNGYNITASGSSSFIRFYTNSGGSSAVEQMRIHTNGYVGIGTASPSYLLHVNGEARFSDVLANYYRYAHWGGNLPHANGNAWYNIYSSTVNTAGDNITLKLSHSFYYTQTDSVVFAINVGYGTGSITQLNSTGGSKIFKKIRVRFVNSATVYVDVQIYSNVANTDSIYVTGTGSGTFRAPTATSDTAGIVKEIDIFYNGFYAPSAKVDTFLGPIVQEMTNYWLTSAKVQIGRVDTTVYSDRAVVGVTNGNLHLDAYKNSSIYFNYYQAPSSSGLLSTAVMIDASGNMGVGIAPNYKLHVNGSVYGDHYYGNAITLYTRGSGTYNRAWISAKDDAGDFIIEAPLTTDSSSGTRAPITLTWRGGFSSKGGLKITGESTAQLGSYTILHTGNYTGTLDGRYVNTTGDTMTGNLVIGNTTIYASGTNGGTNSLAVADDCILGDCNVGGVLGLKATNATIAGIKFFNSSSASLGLLTAVDVNTLKWDSKVLLHSSNWPSYIGVDGYVMRTWTIDATGLDLNTWYPVTMTLPSLHWVRIEVKETLQARSKPSWSTHGSGFHVTKIWHSLGYGWGTTQAVSQRFVLQSDYCWCNTDPVRGIGLLSNSSTEYVYVRGGGKYYVSTSHNVVPTLRTSTYTISSQSIGPTTSTPSTITAMYSDKSIYAPHFYESSDATLKTNIETINTSDNIPQLKSFTWKEDGKHSYGLIAQELEEMGYTELVEESNGKKTVQYSAALSLIVGKLQVKIKELEKEIEILKKKN